MATTDLSRFAIPGVLKFEPGEGGLTRAAITTPQADAHVYLHGAHVTHYHPHNQAPLLFMSAKSQFAAGKPIRGGVPVCFPWFGPKKDDAAAPAHGFARLMEWNVESTAKADDGSVQLVLSLGSDDATRKAWPHDFRNTFTVTIGSELRLSLEVRNTGRDAFTFEEALHTYFVVGDIHKVSIDGLEATDYIDKVGGATRRNQGPQPITFTGETDRVYLNTKATAVAHDVAGGRNISVAKSGSDATVVWNPWIAKAKAMRDFGDDEWPGMLCIETCNVADCAVKLDAGKAHTMTAVIRAEARR
ncbi:MAG TPA: D-hexose-6-phosphate mutarotase [Tepidisphaeraceae bacterium]|nr:D-hexose-6-phosphate mutarotase [Tepidisphaeraceae bacterium]